MSTGSYDAVAAEYYDPSKHPTCADFRRASGVLLERFLREHGTGCVPALELGAGKSVIAECFDRLGLPLNALTLSDASAEMLEYSRPWAARGTTLLAAPVTGLDFGGARFGGVFASLGDPFNDAALWRCVARWLAPGGRCVYTTPAFEWAMNYRTQHDPGAPDVATFVVGGAPVPVPSRILPEAAQRRLIEQSGLRVIEVTEVVRGALEPPATAPKLHLPGSSDDLPIVTAYAVGHYT